jgi:hypothetical protein
MMCEMGVWVFRVYIYDDPTTTCSKTQKHKNTKTQKHKNTPVLTITIIVHFSLVDSSQYGETSMEEPELGFQIG